MELLDIDIETTAILNPTIVMILLFMMPKICECMQVMEDVDIDLNRPDIINPTIVEFITMVIEVMIMVEVDI